MKADTLFRKCQTQSFHREIYFSPPVCTIDTGTADDCLCSPAFAGLGLRKQLISGPAVESKKAGGQKGGPSPGEECLGIPQRYQLLYETAVITSPHGKARSSAHFRVVRGVVCLRDIQDIKDQPYKQHAAFAFSGGLVLARAGRGWSTSTTLPCTHTQPPVTSAGNSQPPCLTLPALNEALINHNFLLFPLFRAWPLTDTSKSGISCRRGFLLSAFIELPLWKLHEHKWIESSQRTHHIWLWPSFHFRAWETFLMLS